MYVDEAEFKEITGREAPENYKELEMRASAELDSVTRFYFQFNELGEDFRSRQFKRAIITQIQFFEEVETTSSESLNNQPDSIRIGSTTVSYNRNSTSAETSKRSSAVSQDALNILKGTGLLYRGNVYGA